MSEEVKAQVGDRVEVYLQGDEIATVRGEVKHTPSATGDSWVIEGDRRGMCHVMHFAMMRIVERKGDND